MLGEPKVKRVFSQGCGRATVLVIFRKLCRSTLTQEMREGSICVIYAGPNLRKISVLRAILILAERSHCQRNVG